MDYFVWNHDDEDDTFAWIKDFPGEVDEFSWKLGKGTSCTDWFPDNPVFPVYSEDGIKLTDAIPNYSGLLIISEKLKAIFEEHSGANVEYLPVRISDKKGRVSPKQYYIANLLDTIDCVDMEKSSYVMSAIIKDHVLRFSELILNEDRLNSENHIFRLKDKTDLILIDDPFSDAILDADCTGMLFQELDDHGSILRD